MIRGVLRGKHAFVVVGDFIQFLQGIFYTEGV